jgi:hypothetical protein
MEVINQSKQQLNVIFENIIKEFSKLENDINEKEKIFIEKEKSFIEKEKFNGKTHDMGFKIYSSFGKGYKVTKSDDYKKVIIKSAQTLCTRFNKKIGSIKSWDNRDRWVFPVIIDNMMNLELLFEASNLTGDKTIFATGTSGNYFEIYTTGTTLKWVLQNIAAGGAGTLTLNSWQHIAVARVNGTISTFVQGVSTASSVRPEANTQNGCRIGGLNPLFMNGNIADLRITKGISRYNANFTPPTAAFADGYY